MTTYNDIVKSIEWNTKATALTARMKELNKAISMSIVRADRAIRRFGR